MLTEKEIDVIKDALIILEEILEHNLVKLENVTNTFANTQTKIMTEKCELIKSVFKKFNEMK